MNCKPPVRANQVVAYVSTERIRLAPPKAGPLFKSFAVQSIMSVAQCHKNKRIVGIVMWKARTKKIDDEDIRIEKSYEQNSQSYRKLLSITSGLSQRQGKKHW